MDVLVCLKRVPLAGGTLILTPDAKDIETKHLGFGISPHEENAVEAGVQLVEQMGGSLTLLTLGPSDAEEQLRAQLAIGANRAACGESVYWGQLRDYGSICERVWARRSCDFT